MVAPPAPAVAQGLVDLIIMLDQAAQEDMRRRELERQQAYEMEQRRAQEEARRQQLLQQQQQEAAQRQAQIDAQREMEIALTRRTQAALTSLGLYDLRIDGDRGEGTRQAEAAYLAAFGLPNFELTEYHVQQLERIAASGFRDQSEIERARRGGFQNRTDLIAAEAGGYANASEYADATRLGFRTAAVYREFLQSGFSDPAEFAAARRAGFNDPGEYREASAAGFSSHDEYADFLESGLPDRAAYEREISIAATRDQARAACMGYNEELEAPVETASSCLVAIHLEVSDQEFQQSFERLGDLLTVRLDAIGDQAIPVVSPAAVTGASEAGIAPGGQAGIHSSGETELDLARKVHACGASLLANAFEQAEGDCDFGPAAMDEKLLSDLRAGVAEQAVSQRLAAEAEAERVRREVEEEQARLALAAAHERADRVLVEIGEFTEAKRSLTAPIDVARAVVALRDAQAEDDITSLEQASAQLEALLGQEADFQAFLREREAAAQTAIVNARATAIAEMERLEAFISQYVAENLLSEHVEDLLVLQAELEAARLSQDPDQITRTQMTARQSIDELGLHQVLAAFVLPEEQESLGATVQTASNGLAVTPLNEALLAGDDRDILILGNYTPSAPHLVLDLLGQTVFDQRTASICWYGASESDTPPGRLALSAVRAIGVDQTQEVAHCDMDAVRAADVVLLRRGDFLTSDVLRASQVVSAFEASELRLISTIAWSEVGNFSEQKAEIAAQIEADVMAGDREGFGLISVSNNGEGVCLVALEQDQEARIRILRTLLPDLDGLVGEGTSITIRSLDQAFYDVQRAECSTLYAGHEDLRALLEGLKRAAIPYSVVPVWVEPAEIEAVTAALAEEREAEQREIALQEQEAQALAALDAEARRDAELVRQNEQAALRQQYGSEARAAFDEMDIRGRSFLEADPAQPLPAEANLFARLFPLTADWKLRQGRGGWEIARIESDLVDYGTAEWQGRRAEAVFARFVASSENRQLGQYSDECFLFGYIIDAEFSMIRDAIETDCDDSGSLLEWKTGRSFESRWVAE